MEFKTFQGKDVLFKDAEYIRTMVFVEEQGVLKDIEMDDLDDRAIHIVMYNENLPIATGRIVEIEPKVYKVGRVAVLKEFRGQKLGYKVMEKIIEICKESDFKEIRLNAQLRAKDFYKSLGFIENGEIFLEANIEHIAMYLGG
ncbi:GNAT family N-acetyltransferase [Clostridium sp.]|uniref:GNAT family N-acetyltransferase n=1 Tax=Clostridium sp. TaxID=1506 RepID=UPI0034640B7C